MTPQEWLALLVSQGPALRAAGYSSIQLEGISAKLAPPYGEPLGTHDRNVATVDDVRALASDPEPSDEVGVLDDPATYGGDVPGYERDEDDA